MKFAAAALIGTTAASRSSVLKARMHNILDQLIELDGTAAPTAPTATAEQKAAWTKTETESKAACDAMEDAAKKTECTGKIVTAAAAEAAWVDAETLKATNKAARDALAPADCSKKTDAAAKKTCEDTNKTNAHSLAKLIV